MPKHLIRKHAVQPVDVPTDVMERAAQRVADELERIRTEEDLTAMQCFACALYALGNAMAEHLHMDLDVAIRTGLSPFTAGYESRVRKDGH